MGGVKQSPFLSNISISTALSQTPACTARPRIGPVYLFTLQLLLVLTLPLQDGQAELTRVVNSRQMFFYFTQFYCHQFPHPSTELARHTFASGPCLRVTNLLHGLGNASCSVDVPSSTTDKLLELMCSR